MFGITLAEHWFAKTIICVVILRFAPQKIAETLVWINNQASDIKIEFNSSTSRVTGEESGS